MPFKKFIPDPGPHKLDHCNHPEHNPPTMLVLKPGTYTWQCPACGHTVTFTVSGYYLDSKNTDSTWRCGNMPQMRPVCCAN